CDAALFPDPAQAGKSVRPGLMSGWKPTYTQGKLMPVSVQRSMTWANGTAFLPQGGFRPHLPSGILAPEDRVSNGIWPRRFAVWMAAFYVALFIIRPWEEMLPLLGDLH